MDTFNSGGSLFSPADFQFNVPTLYADSATTGAAPAGQVPATNLGLNVPTAQMALSGLGTIGNLWAGFQAAKLAKQQFNFQKDFANANLANQIKSYNTALYDRARSRAAMEGQSSGQMQSYVNANSLSRIGH